MSDGLTVPYGYSNGIPEGVTAAWGCRAIFSDGVVDVVHDRQGYDGPATPRRELADYMWDRVRDVWKWRAKRMHDSGELADEQGHVLYEDERVTVKGRAAGGYLYVCAYFTPASEQRTEP